MKHDVKAPSVGESITEVSILKWLKQSGQAVKTGELLLEIESDKATVEIVAETSGVLQILKQNGERVPVGEVIAQIDDAGKATVAASAGTSAPAPASRPAPAMQASAGGGVAPAAVGAMSPAVRRLTTEQGLDVNQIPGTGRGGRVTKGDVLGYQAPAAGTTPAGAPHAGTTPAGAPHAGATPAGAPMYRAPQPAYQDRPGDRRVPMTSLRAKIAERLVQAQHTAAILTTFNEADMSAVMALRNQHKDSFKAKHGVSLSFMSFFTLASIEALKAIPEVNASVNGRDIIYHDYFDIGVAVGTDRGLVVPVLRDAGKMSVVDIEKKIAELAVKARDGKLSINDMTGGTFTISNGGTYGSLMSTPILNPPQSGILGMHKIMERPMAINGKVEIRPMMYLALSYDHRIIDGKGAVTFLVTLKDFIEHPEKLKISF
jgi:2-oxoglutarate dehydrogenase E2 component (dihydrolipoamide succinyltransferase)